MEGKEESKLTLVLDSNVFIKKIDVRSKYDADFCTVPEVLAEIRDEKTRQYISALPYTLENKSPTKKSLEFVKNFAMLTGDFHSLSAADLKLIALAHTLLLERNEAGELRDKPSDPLEPVARRKAESSGDEEMEVKEERKPRREAPELKEDEAWITPENIDQGIYFGREKIDNEVQTNTIDTKKSVGIVTSDFSMQNVILQIGIPLYSPDGAMISQIKQFILRCRACREYFLRYRRINKESKTGFCSECGNYGLEKIVVKVDAQGNIRYGNFRRNVNTRGTIVSCGRV
eukprot:TRINITY_DN559_c0_g1_i26.p2 TRINITY_DN559_c0_g1~~TRINITY_DN559_c0_g1_i26.p2  ORF type:complete len:288 (+),score=93.19 TRINITY_DN559_c0_g1_i26:166-1029(+)